MQLNGRISAETKQSAPASRLGERIAVQDDVAPEILAAPIHPVEDDFHRLQTATTRSIADGVDGTFDDGELADAVRVALWNIGLTRHEIVVDVREQVITLAGTLSSEQRHKDALEAIAAVWGNREVIDEIEVASQLERAGPVPSPDYQQNIAPAPMLSVTRYCSLEATSMMAAIRGSLAMLKRHLAERRVKGRHEAVLIYRNVRPETVTLETGLIVSQRASMSASGEIVQGLSPADQTLFSRPMAGGVRGLAQALEALRRDAVSQRFGEPTLYWHRPIDPHDPWAVAGAGLLCAAWS